MTDTLKAGGTDRATRAQMIMDAAADLLLQHGYRRVTIDGVARAAGVGKGTVYLHWHSREELLLGVLLRESAELTDELVECLRTDPRDVLPHRMSPLAYLATYRRPLTRAMFTQDAGMIGRLLETEAGRQLQASKARLTEIYYRTLVDHGMVREELDLGQVVFGSISTAFGFFTVSGLVPMTPEMTVENRAAILAHVMRHAFETPDAENRPDLPVVAGKVADEYERFRDMCWAEAHGRGRETPA
ncbi:transcriptional regulator, TetR family [Streptoalloteichus tenebrarius]|uniref:Transcriptional regulator, TetR family n=1 Tax=Streptoalloteichus tenebrarius (strain ATCC 17920 / DSM 40477 / JCM 4838 / CBS 697.72 / NBRC 16177 / NCIMB 11028 / NRRL B-12390 / A12253. 1 / ISP 5477) TaxID=1933 RepID=A0ABT1HWW6_STRSD|nr:TetR/AcrR family transcriptional regulator [Streptoalloteichus tenebrarius]MCP2260027.1 transcriptional regulator, TetR family [Streptoalloteichus tenebrarius]BFF03857.1 TetR/AcrR family transcriptional regulator [Streptoalloteichus tenebrarius]